MSLSERVVEQQKLVRKLAIDSLGGKCIVCDTTKNLYVRGKDKMFLICKKCVSGVDIKRLWMLARKHLGGACISCGSKRKLQIHHVDGDWQNHSDGNAVLLCFDCHRILHQGMIRVRYTDEDEKRVRKTVKNYLRSRNA